MQELLQHYENEGECFLDRIIAIDETWVCNYEPKLKSQSNVWLEKGQKKPVKFHRVQSKVKQLMIFAYNKHSIIATDRVPVMSTVTVDYYQNFLRKVLQPKVQKL